MSSSTRKHRRKNRSKRNKFSGCTALSKKQCRFPCKSVMSGKNRAQFKHCRTIFSEKETYLSANEKRVVYNGLKRAEKSDQTSQKLHKQASHTRKKEKKAKLQADKLEADAEKEDTKTKSILTSVSESLFGTPSVKTEPETVVEPETAVEPEPETVVEPEPEPEPVTVESEPVTVVPEPEKSEQEPAVESDDDKKEGI